MYYKLSVVKLIGVILISFSLYPQAFTQNTTFQIAKDQEGWILKMAKPSTLDIEVTPFKVYVGMHPSMDEVEVPPVVGNYTQDSLYWIFKPTFLFRPGKTYTAFDKKGLHFKFTIPEEKNNLPTSLTQIFPSADTLPSNILKFYLHFSAKMGANSAYPFLTLMNEQGDTLQDPFVQLDPELWNQERTRLTLWFDPGRIKRALGPNAEKGPVLIPDNYYRLIVSEHWRDANGQKLEKAFEKSFFITEADRTQPDPRKWHIQIPNLDTTDPLIITFNESFDRALLHKFVFILNDQFQQSVAGTIKVDQQERRWSFSPNQPWLKGSYAIRINTFLEDLAGNNFVRLFDTDLANDPRENQEVQEYMELLFAIE